MKGDEKGDDREDVNSKLFVHFTRLLKFLNIGSIHWR